MNQLWGIVIPEETINLVTNPSFSLGTDFWEIVTAGTTLARSTNVQKFGPASLEVTPAAGTFAGTYWGAFHQAVGEWITVSCWFRGRLAIPYRLVISTLVPATLATTAFVGTGDWQKVTLSYQEPSTAGDRRIDISKNNSSDIQPFYIDAVQVERKAYATTFCDGTQEGCYWLGSPYLSASRRIKNRSSAGREINLGDFDASVQAVSGIGFPPNRHLVQEHARLDGARYQGRKILQRTMQIVSDGIGDSQVGLHRLRKMLVDAIKPDRQDEDTEIMLYYYGANPEKPAEIKAIYDSGLEYHDIDGFTETMPIRFIAYEPFWCEIGEVVAHLEIEKTVGPPSHVVARIDNDWQAIEFNGAVYGVAECLDGRIVFVGNFTQAGGAPANRIVLYDRLTEGFTALGSGLNGAGHCVAVAPNGDIFVGGVFTDAGGQAVSNLARYDWSAGTWHNVSGGANDIIRAIAIAPDGGLFITGDFTEVGTGPLAANRIARLLSNLITWEALGAGLNGSGRSLAIRDFGIVNEVPMFVVFVGGWFTDAGGSGAQYVSAYGYGMVSGWWDMQGGVDDIVWKIFLGKDQNLYVGGNFTEAAANSTNPIPASRIAYWYGGVSANKWRQVGDGLEYECRIIGEFDEADRLIVAEVSGALEWPRFSIWNGVSFIPSPMRKDGIAILYDTLLSKGDFFICSHNVATSTVPELNTVVNVGSASVRPRIVIRRDGGDSVEIRGIYNLLTGDELHLAYNLLDGEELVIRLDEQDRTVESSYFGEVPTAVLRGSNLGRWRLLPGENPISVFVASEGAPSIQAYMTYVPRHWSVDGVAE